MSCQPPFTITSKMIDLIKSHKILMQELLKDCGKYRQANVGVGRANGVTHVAPPHERVSDLMRDLFKWINSTNIHPSDC